MNVVLSPNALHGTVQVPSSKSIGHRDLICAALAEGESIVENISPSQDIEATCRILCTLGAVIEKISSDQPGRAAYRIQGGLHKRNLPLRADCSESGSTLRFLIPVGILSGNTITFQGRGRLAQRPLEPYYGIFRQRDIHYQTTGRSLPLTVCGDLTPGRYALPGDVSSQFFTGLLLTLPLIHGDSLLCSTTPLESASYVDMTLSCLQQHGVFIDKERDGSYHIQGHQQYRPGRYTVEGDYSQAAFWLTAGILGKYIRCTGLRRNSLQGDEVILSLIRDMGGRIDDTEAVHAFSSQLRGRTIDVEDCPDLVPILAVLATFSTGMTHIIHAGRVRFKECDRLHAIAAELNAIGAAIQEEPEGLVIHGVHQLSGGRVSGWNDHRIAMALAVASQRCTGNLVIEGAECVRKSYPDFWQDFKKLGGICRQEG